MMISIRILSPLEWSEFNRHLKQLSADDRRMRFGSTVSDVAIDAHIDRLRPLADTVIAAFANDLELIGAALITRDSSDSVEVSVSVIPEWRGHGIGTNLMRRATLWARNRGYQDAAVRFLSENMPMFRLARRSGMRVAKDLGDAEGRLALAPSSWLSHALELSEEATGLARYAMIATGAARRWHASSAMMPVLASTAAKP